MSIRKMMLPTGWYPRRPDEIKDLLRRWSRLENQTGKPGGATGMAGIVPHAGWAFSGKLAFRVISRLQQADLVVIAGGHLPAGGDPVCVAEEGIETPLGILETDTDFMQRLFRRGIRFLPDHNVDNTVEVQLPMIKYCFSQASILAIRVPPAHIAVEIGKTLASEAHETGRSVVVIGSTDLTHYGPNYGFVSHGTGETALEWVQETNDRNFVDACIDAHPDAIIDRAQKDRSACSAGGAAAACSYAVSGGRSMGHLVGYHTSFEIHPSDSFVGYAGILY